ncbi:MAG: hypothetical protein KC636_21750 [Myxococcales bacterium]|nr:hypothetical protein [Myxococcales bacterium]
MPEIQGVTTNKTTRRPKPASYRDRKLAGEAEEPARLPGQDPTEAQLKAINERHAPAKK